MPRSPLPRLRFAALFAIVTLAVPGEAVAHGTAHHREHEDAAHHATADPHDAGAVISSADHEHEHQHPQVGGAARTRVEGPTLDVVLPVRVPELLVISRAPAAPARRATLARGDPHTGPPPRLRAPPTR